MGNVQTIADPNAGGTQTQSFTYDQVDRLYTASASGGTEGPYAITTTINAIGNITSKTGMAVYTYGAQSASCPEGALSKPHAVVTAGSTPTVTTRMAICGDAP